RRQLLRIELEVRILDRDDRANGGVKAEPNRRAFAGIPLGVDHRRSRSRIQFGFRLPASVSRKSVAGTRKSISKILEDVAGPVGRTIVEDENLAWHGRHDAPQAIER